MARPFRAGVSSPASTRALCSFFSRATLVGGERHRQRTVGLEVALDVEPPQQGGEIERRAAPGLERVPRRLEANEFFDIDEADTGVLGNPAGDRLRGAAAETVGLDERDLMPAAANA